VQLELDFCSELGSRAAFFSERSATSGWFR
jgi:hypothetical protein